MRRPGDGDTTHEHGDGTWPWGLAIDAGSEVRWIGFEGPAALEAGILWLLNDDDSSPGVPERGQRLTSLERLSEAVALLDQRLAPFSRVEWWGPSDLLVDADEPLARLVRIEFRRSNGGPDHASALLPAETDAFRRFLVERD